MWRYVTLFLCVLMMNGCNALDINRVTLRNNNIPGSFIVQYGGIQGKLVNEGSRWVEREARRWQWELHQAGEIDIFEFHRRQQEITWQIQDARVGGQWGNRSWLESFLPEKGGAPKEPYVHMYGRTYIVFDGGLFTLSNAGDFQFKEWSKEFDVKPNAENDEPSGTAWAVRLRPNASFSFSNFLDDPVTGLREVGLTARFTHIVRNIPMLEISVDGEYDFARDEIRVFAQLQLLQW